MTEAARPTRESGPEISIILSATTREPLPETGLKNMREISSSGIAKKLKTGAAAFSMKSMAPDDVSASIPIKIPLMKGSMSLHV